MNVRGAPPPSPPGSIARSSNGTGHYPMPSSDGGIPPQYPQSRSASPGPPGPPVPPGATRKYSPQMLEQQLAVHHRVLKDFLSQNFREGHQPPNRARDKLLRLSPIQFQELSTDVYDELLRREDERHSKGPDGHGRSVPRFLLPRNNFHPKRNQARQKLSTLAMQKFRELATDVLFELERRFPRFGNGRNPLLNLGPGSLGPPRMRRPSNASSINAPYSPAIFDGHSTPGSTASGDFSRPFPGPRNVQSNTMIPNKGTMVEDDGTSMNEDDDPYDIDGTTLRMSRRTTNKSMAYSIAEGGFKEQIQSLEQKLEELQSQLQQKEDQLASSERAVEEERATGSALQSDLEKQLNSANSRNDSLQREVDTLRVNSVQQEDDHDLRGRYDTLIQDFEIQQQMTDEVKDEAAHSLSEMRSLADQLSQRAEHEEALSKRVSELEAIVDDWRSRHAKTHAHLRDLKSGSMGLYINDPTSTQFAQTGSITDPKGLISDVSVSRFQLSIDELLQLARKDEPVAIMNYMPTLVDCIRGITQDIDQASAGIKEPEESKKQRMKAKAKVSAATNNLITASKNHSTSNGMTPLSLIDAAATHLTLAVIELAKIVKVRHSTAAELADEMDFR